LGPSWAYAFLAASLVTLVGTPVLRRIALATEFVDHPIASHKSHKRPTPYLGGIGLIVAVLVGLLFASRLTAQVAVVALGGSLIGCLGLLDDHRSVGALVRFVVELLVAVVTLAAGLRIHATDVPAIDGSLTLVWIVGVTNAVNLLDNMDGLAAGVSAAGAVAVFALAVLGEQLVTATLAAGLAGACAGFLAHNKRPASIFMGDTGSLFLGFVLALATIDVSPALTPPASFAVPLMLLALPVLDTATVTVCRLRRDRSIVQGGKDHLSHRLVARGLSPGTAVGALVAVEAAAGILAVVAGREVLPLLAAVLAVAAMLSGLGWYTSQAKVYDEAVVGLPRTLKLLVGAGALATVALAAPATIALARAYGPGVSGSADAKQALLALHAGQGGRAAALFRRAEGSLRTAHDLLAGRAVSAGLLLPGLRANVATTRAVVEVSHEVVASAADLSALAGTATQPVTPGADTVAQARRLAPTLAASDAVLQRAVSELAGYDRPYLLPSLGKTVRDLRVGLRAASSEATTAAEVARLVPALLGQDGARHYFLAVQDSAELRGSGGVVHLWGEIAADGERLGLTRFGPVTELDAAAGSRAIDGPVGFADRYRDFDPANTWENVNVSPDFGVTGEVISRLYPQSGGRPVDGVVAVDASGLAALVKLAGPVVVDGWPVPVTAADLTDILVRDAAARFPVAAEREAFVGRLVKAVVDTFLAADLGTSTRLVGALGEAVAGGHLRLYATSADEERLFDHLGAAGHLAPPATDSLMLVNQNLTATPVDTALRRLLDYHVEVDPGRQPAAVTGHVEVSLVNDAPTDNRSYVSVYSPFGSLSAQPGVEAASELGRQAYSATLTVPAGQSRSLTVEVAGRLELQTGNWYRLDLPHQASLSADQTEVSVSVPAGWRIAEVRGPIRTADDRHAVVRLAASGDEAVAVRLERTPWSRLWARIRP
jgi:UDP-GlcNAc:undecaprenyl-phosphate GlcNAc-1-phosphate transferase